MSDLNSILLSLAKEDYCYLTTTGRVSGRPHEIEIWFGLDQFTLYLMSGDGKSDWVRNLLKNPAVMMRIKQYTFNATARIVQDEAEQMLARNMLADKYKEREADGALSEWVCTALVIGVDLSSVQSR